MEESSGMLKLSSYSGGTREWIFRVQDIYLNRRQEPNLCSQATAQTKLLVIPSCISVYPVDTELFSGGEKKKKKVISAEGMKSYLFAHRQQSLQSGGKECSWKLGGGLDQIM